MAWDNPGDNRTADYMDNLMSSWSGIKVSSFLDLEGNKPIQAFFEKGISYFELT